MNLAMTPAMKPMMMVQRMCHMAAVPVLLCRFWAIRIWQKKRVFANLRFGCTVFVRFNGEKTEGKLPPYFPCRRNASCGYLRWATASSPSYS